MQALSDEFKKIYSPQPESGAAISLWLDGEEVFSSSIGFAREGQAWNEQSLVPVFSATKAASAAAFLLALDDKSLTPELKVSELWPRFPHAGLSVAELLSHQAGLAALSRPCNLFDLDDVRDAVESTIPAWQPPKHGYHPHTMGPILDILMLELMGMRLGEFWEKRVRAPLGLDFYIGLPESEFERVAFLRAARFKGAMPQDDFYQAFFDETSDIYRSFHSVKGLQGVREMNLPKAWRCADPARGGIASARGLAMFYQSLMGLLPESPFNEKLLAWLTKERSSGFDCSLLQPTAFSCGMMLEPIAYFSIPYVQASGFGHAGAGGCHAFALKEAGFSFSYVHNQMELGVLPSERVLSLMSKIDVL